MFIATNSSQIKKNWFRLSTLKMKILNFELGLDRCFLYKSVLLLFYRKHWWYHPLFILPDVGYLTSLTLPKPYLSKKFTNVCNNFKTLFSICFSPFSPPRDQSVVSMGEFLNLPKLLWCTPFIPHAYVLNSIEDTSKIVYRDSWIIIFMSALE